MVRSLVALIVGVIVAFSVVLLVEGLGHAIYPPPAGLDPSDPEQIASVLRDMPLVALLFPLAAWLLATVTGGLAACIISRRRPGLHASFVGALVLAATVWNLMAIPHPTWMAALAILGIPVMVFLTARLAPAMIAQETGISDGSDGGA